MTRARTQAGLSIPEVLLALLILMTASTATMAAVGSSKRNTAGAQRSTEATRLAQATLDDMRGLEYAQLGLPADLTDGGVPIGRGDSARFNLGQGTLRVGNGNQLVNEPLVQPSNGGSLNDGQAKPGEIDPGPDAVTVSSAGGQGTSFLVYKYVTWKDENCFGIDGDDECPVLNESDPETYRDHDIKRVVVAVLPGRLVGQDRLPVLDGRANGPTRTVWMSSLIADPNETAAIPPCVGTCTGGQSYRTPRQSFFMTDVSCRDSDIYNPYDTAAFPQSTHTTRRTSDWGGDNGWSSGQGVASCRNAPSQGNANNSCYQSGTQLCKPDLLSISQPLEADCESNPTNCADASKAWYSSDLKESASVYGYGPFSRVVQRASGCTYSATPGSATTFTTTTPNNSMVQTWATNKFEAGDFVSTNNSGFLLKGHIFLQFYVGLFGSTVSGDNGKACVTLIDRDEGANGTDPTANDKIIYEFICQSNQWPIGRSNYFGVDPPFADNRGGKLLRPRQQCFFNPVVSQKNTFRSTSDPLYSKVVSFPSGGYTIANGHRLVLRIAADSQGGDGSQNPLVFYYGIPAFASEISVSTDNASQLIEDENR